MSFTQETIAHRVTPNIKQNPNTISSAYMFLNIYLSAVPAIIMRLSVIVIFPICQIVFGIVAH